jgi:complex III assembly factor LYRM7
LPSEVLHPSHFSPSRSLDTDPCISDDTRTLTASRRLAHAEFNRNRKLESGSIEASNEVERAQGVARILREHVVQGRKVGGEDEERYKLNIHEHTQRLDNETATKLKGTTKTLKEIKNAQF